MREEFMKDCSSETGNNVDLLLQHSSQTKFERKKSSSRQKVPGYAMALFDSLPRNSVYFFCFCFFGYLWIKKVIITGMTLQIENYNKKSERIIKRTPKWKRTSSLWCLVPAKPFFFPQVNMQGITKLGFTFFGFRRLLSLISMEVRFGPTRKI